jgi:hypothetical protein
MPGGGAFMDLIPLIGHLYRRELASFRPSPYGPFVLCDAYPFVEA